MSKFLVLCALVVPSPASASPAPYVIATTSWNNERCDPSASSTDDWTEGPAVEYL